MNPNTKNIGKYWNKSWRKKGQYCLKKKNSLSPICICICIGQYSYSVTSLISPLSLTDSSASIVARRWGFSRTDQELHQLAVVVWDGGEPVLSSTTTLTLRVCPCQRGLRSPTCRPQAFFSSAGLSTGALIAILLCVLILLGNTEYQHTVMLKLTTKSKANTSVCKKIII